MPTTFVSARGFDTRLLVAGSDDLPPLVLLHDLLPGSAADLDWNETSDRLGQDFRVLAPDLLGFGGSHSDFPVRSGVSAWTRARASQVAAALDELAVDRAYLVAVGLSGPLALTIMSTDPDRFAGACLIGPAGGRIDPTPELRFCLAFYDDPCVEAITSRVTWANLGEQQVLALSQQVRIRYEEAMRPDVRQAFESCFHGPDAPEHLVVPPAALHRIDHRIALVHGREDRIVPAESSLDLQRNLTNAAVHLLPGLGHAAAPDLLDRVIRTCLLPLS